MLTCFPLSNILTTHKKMFHQTHFPVPQTHGPIPPPPHPLSNILKTASPNPPNYKTNVILKPTFQFLQQRKHQKHLKNTNAKFYFEKKREQREPLPNSSVPQSLHLYVETNPPQKPSQLSIQDKSKGPLGFGLWKKNWSEQSLQPWNLLQNRDNNSNIAYYNYMSKNHK